MEIRFDCSSLLHLQREQERETERERGEREVRKRRERGVNLVEINKFFNCIRL